MNKLKPEIFDAVFSPALKPLEVQLDFCVEDRVAASDVCQNRMLSTAVVADRNLMLLAGVAAVTTVGAVREETAEHTVLGVKDGKMTERDDF